MHKKAVQAVCRPKQPCDGQTGHRRATDSGGREAHNHSNKESEAMIKA